MAKHKDTENFESASELSQFTGTPIADTMEAVERLEDASSQEAPPSSDLLAPAPTWDEVGLGVPREGRVSDFDPTQPTVQYGGPVIDATGIDYSDLATGNTGPRPTVPPQEDQPEPNGVPDHAMDEDPVVSGNDATEFNLSPNFVLTKDEQSQIIRDRIRDIEAEKVRKELAAWEGTTLGMPDPDQKREIDVLTYQALQMQYVETYNRYVEGGGE